MEGTNLSSATFVFSACGIMEIREHLVELNTPLTKPGQILTTPFYGLVEGLPNLHIPL